LAVYDKTLASLHSNPRRWLVTGAAGFIGSHLVEQLLQQNQQVYGFDNLSTGKWGNLAEVRQLVGEEKWARFTWCEGSLLDLPALENACQGIDIVLHQAALGSVPRSIAQPLETHAANVTGFAHLLTAAHRSGIRRLVYASSSAVYGDSQELPKTESHLGRVLSPYAASKLANEIYAEAFATCYGMELMGLRYFNVFGARQDPTGPYSAVIPQWISSLLRNEIAFINGDGETSRDYVYVDNVVQANLLAALTASPEALNQVYNIAANEQTTLNHLFAVIVQLLTSQVPGFQPIQPAYREFRPGDIRHSFADISRARDHLGYSPTHTLASGLKEALPWYCNESKKSASRS
jgi:UDP-N-acetylglucosamine 4-epimerase